MQPPPQGIIFGDADAVDAELLVVILPNGPAYGILEVLSVDLNLSGYFISNHPCLGEVLFLDDGNTSSQGILGRGIALGLVSCQSVL